VCFFSVLSSIHCSDIAGYVTGKPGKTSSAVSHVNKR